MSENNIIFIARLLYVIYSILMDKKSIRISPNGILSTGLERKITILSSHFGVNGTLAEDIHVILDQM